MNTTRRWFILMALTLPIAVVAQGNGKLQIHFMNVGQGDGALLISPLGETVMFDDGVPGRCDKTLKYLQNELHLTGVDYHIASHYHQDHIGCFDVVGGNIVVQVGAGDASFTVTYNGSHTDSYLLWESTGPTPPSNEGPQIFWWSKSSSSKVYHYADCSSVNLTRANWDHGSSPPVGRTLHKKCPK